MNPRFVLTTLISGLCAQVHAAAGAPSLSDLKQLNVEDLMRIEVTSVARRPEKLTATASAIQVITQPEIRRSGATTLAEALRLADNLQVAQRRANGWAITARGFNTDLANKLLVMIDGRTVYTPLYSGVFWEAQDYLLEDIDRIEVISGPGGTLWGANAVNGVINVITRSASQTQGLHAEVGAGSELESLVGFRFGASPSANVAMRAYGKFIEGDDSVLTAGTPAGNGWRRVQGGFRLDAAPSAQDTLTVQGDAHESEQLVPGNPDSRIRGANLLGRWTRHLGNGSEFSLQTYIDQTRLALPVGAQTIGALTFAPAGVLEDELTTFDVDLQHRLRAGTRHHVTWGLGFRHLDDSVQGAPGLTFLPEKLAQELYSAFVQDEILLRDALILTLGTKLEHTDYTGLEVEPSARLQWSVRPDQTLWAAVSRAVRTPSRVDRDMSQAAPPYLTLLRGDADFDSEKVVAYELGWRAQTGTRLSTSVATFYNSYEDLRSTDITPTTLLPFFFANDVEGHSYGAELNGDLQLMPNWTLHGGYTLLQSSLRVKAGRFDLTNARNETSDPQHQASLRTSATLPGRIELDAGLRWVDTLRNSNGPETGSVPSYFELDARLGWQVSDRLELSVVGRNLLHDHHPEYGFPSAARGEIERSVYGKLAWRY